MSELWQGVLLGALLSIPIGIFVNVLSPTINRAIERRSSQAAEKRASQDEQFRQDAARLAKDRSALYSVLLESLLRIAYITAIFGVFAGALVVIGQIVPPALEFTYLLWFPLEYVSSFIFAASQLVALVGTIIVLNIARQAIVLIREVRSVARSPQPE